MPNKSIHISEKTYQRMNRVIGERMVRVERRWMNVQEFIRDAVNEKIERWKRRWRYEIQAL